MYLIGRNLLITESFGSNTCKYKAQCEKKKRKKKKRSVWLTGSTILIRMKYKGIKGLDTGVWKEKSVAKIMI